MKIVIMLFLSILCALSTILNATIYGVQYKLVDSATGFSKAILTRVYESQFQKSDYLTRSYMIMGVYISENEQSFRFGYSLMRNLKTNAGEKQYEEIIKVNKWIPLATLSLIILFIFYFTGNWINRKLKLKT